MAEPSVRPILFSGAMVRAILDGRKTQTRRVMTRPRVGLPRRVASEDIIQMAGLGRSAKAGIYPAEMNPLGAVSAVLPDGQKLGLRPGEFNWLCPYADGPTHLSTGKDRRWTITPQDSRLWVRETWAAHWMYDGTKASEARSHLPDDNRWFAADPEGAVGTHGCSPQGRRGKWRPSIHMPRWASRITLEVTGVRVERLQDISEADIIAEGCTVDVAAKVTGIGWSNMPTLHDAFRYLWDHINGVGAWERNQWLWVIEFKKLEVPRV